LVVALFCAAQRGDGPATHRGQGGFSLIELLTVIVVAGILAVYGLPNLISLIRADTLSTSANKLVFALNYARNEAVKRDAQVYVCPSSDGATCTNGSSWAIGWMVYILPSGSSTPTPLQSWPALPSNFTLVSKQNGTTTAAAAPVTYQPNGLTYSSALAMPSASTTEFIFCSAQGISKAVDVELMPTGRVETSLTPGQNLQGNALATTSSCS
jgi:prepilin-type N-terminal cleavage/methylation domain-containing protein